MTAWSEEAIRAALAGEDGGRAVEAAELVAAAAGHVGELSDDGRAWVVAHGVPSDELVEQALRRVRDLCAAETDEAAVERLRDLRYRLGDAAAR